MFCPGFKKWSLWATFSRHKQQEKLATNIYIYFFSSWARSLCRLIMPFSHYGEEPCVNIWRYCTAVLQIVTFGRQSAKQFTELQGSAAETVDFFMCDVRSVRKRWCGNKISKRSLGAQSDTGMSSPGRREALERSVQRPLPPLMVGQHRKATQRGQSLNGNSPLMSGQTISTQQSLCKLPAGRFSYANGLSPCTKESSC